ncbi:uncharacterized protein BDV14DRAFT_202190 [Aspergillus stella-maris]|uniref:uncharacterized protein n=1 Tax=Aspergillus stella-maris TaxID=1810926 RepID=UPI003CCE496F
MNDSTIFQPQSPFLTKLPPEIRCQIYELFFADVANTVTIFTLSPGTNCSNPNLRFPGDNLQHRICTAKGLKRHTACFPRLHPHRTHQRPCDCQSNIDTTSLVFEHRDQRVSLLLTCRVIYTGSLTTLWSLTIPHLSITTAKQCRILSNIQWALSHSAFHAIRSLEVSFSYILNMHRICRRQVNERLEGDPWLEHWGALWSVIGTMEGLRRVKVWIALHGEAYVRDVEGERRVLGPLRRLYAERTKCSGGGMRRVEFDVEVLWKVYEESYVGEGSIAVVPSGGDGARFRLNRMDDDKVGPGSGSGFVSCGIACILGRGRTVR